MNNTATKTIAGLALTTMLTAGAVTCLAADPKCPKGTTPTKVESTQTVTVKLPIYQTTTTVKETATVCKPNAPKPSPPPPKKN